MTIYKGSRYEYSTIDYVSTKDGNPEEPIVFYTFSDIGLINYHEHHYMAGERLEQIAYKYYNNPEYWWVIPEYNPEILDFTNIKPNTILRIPNV
jgi:hypothetical protein